MIVSGIKHHMQTKQVIFLCTTLVQNCSLKVRQVCSDYVGSRVDFLISRHHRTSTSSRLYNTPNFSLSATRLLSPLRATQSYDYSGSCFTSTHRTPANPAILSPFAQYMAGHSRRRTEPSSPYFTSLKFTRSYHALLFYPRGRVPEIPGRMMYSALC